MKIILAPMEGVIDHHMRKALTGIGGYDACVTEFVRVTDLRLPTRVFKRLSPELNEQGKTTTGEPVIVQLLGGDPEIMAINAQKAAQLDAPGIDINFGCPSKIVNRKMGGSILLREPERVHAIVKAVRDAVDINIPVSAKMRLGYDDDQLALDNAWAIETAGASALTVHSRTKVDGYRAPARWEALAPIREAVNIPLIANGDINSLDDYQRCASISGCEDVMLGRGAVSDPSLARQIKQYQNGESVVPMGWRDISALILHTCEQMTHDYPPKFLIMRIKQWLNICRKHSEEGQRVFNVIRRMNDLGEIQGVLNQVNI